MKGNSRIVVGIVLVLVVVGVFLFLKSTTLAEEPIKIGVIVYPGFAPFYIAQEKGFFENQGINAEVVTINDPVQAISVLASGDVQILFSSADFTPFVASTGVDVKEIFASDVGYGSDGLLVKDDVNSIQDLRGKTVYLSMGTPSHFLLRFLAKEEGLQNEDISLVQMEADQVGAAFVSGGIDYGMSWEPWLSKASEREGGKLLFTSKDSPGIITDTFIVRADTLNSRRDDVKAVVRAWFDSIEFMETNPDEANSIMAENLGLPKEEFELFAESVKFLSYEENLAKFDRTTDLNIFELTDEAIEIYTEDGILESVVDTEDVIDSTLLKDLYN